MKYPQEFYNVVALLCLLRCLYPPIQHDFRWLKGVKVLPSPVVRSGGAPKSHHQKLVAPNGALGLLDSFSGFEHKFHHKWPDFFGTNAKFFYFNPGDVGAPVNNNITAFIYADGEQPMLSPIVSARRNLTEPNPTGGIRQDDLSLEDIDLIDCLWRQDIDAEKGFFASIQPPENQYETDLFLLSEKSILQGNRVQLSVVDENVQKKSGDLYLNKFDDVYPGVKQQTTKNDDVAFKSSDQQNALSNFSEIFDSQKISLLDDDFDPAFLDFFNSTNDNFACGDFQGSDRQATPLLRNATLTSVVAAEDSNDNKFFAPSADFDYFAPPSSFFADLSLPPNHGDPLLSALPTPSLTLTDVDVERLFADRQVAVDVARWSERSLSPLASTARSTTMLDHESGAHTPPFSDRSSAAKSRSSFSSSVDDVCEETFAADMSNGVPSSSSYPLADTPSTSSDPRFNPSPDPFVPTTERYHGHDDDGPSTSRRAYLHDHPYYTVQQAEAPILFRPTIRNVPASPEPAFFMDEECPFEPSLKDERLVKQYNIDVPAYDIINMPFERLQQVLLDNPRYGPEQVDVVRKIRRRGRNKVAARNCRQRRFGAVERLAVEVDFLESELAALLERRRSLESIRRQELEKLDRLAAKNL